MSSKLFPVQIQKFKSILGMFGWGHVRRSSAPQFKGCELLRDTRSLWSLCGSRTGQTEELCCVYALEMWGGEIKTELGSVFVPMSRCSRSPSPRPCRACCAAPGSPSRCSCAPPPGGWAESPSGPLYLPENQRTNTRLVKQSLMTALLKRQ